MANGAKKRDFEALLENSPHAIVISDHDGRIVVVNRETERMFGYSRTQLLGQPIEILVPERFRRGHVQHRRDYMTSPSMRSLGASRCLLGRRKDGTEFPTEIGLSYVRSNGGLLVMSAIADTTQRKQAEETLRRTSETLQALVQASPVGITVLDPEGRVEMWNAAAERIFGWSPDEVLGRPLPTIPEGKEEEHRALRETVLNGGVSSGVELQRRRKDGRPVDISLSTAPLRGPDGNVSGIVGLMADVTERKRAEQVLRESEARFRTTVDSLKEGFQVVGFDWRYLLVNDAVAQQGRRAKESLIGHTMMEMYPGIDETEMFGHLRRCMEQRVPHRMENEFVYPDGGTAWFELDIQPVDEGICILSQDVTDRKSAEEKLVESERLFRAVIESAPDGIVIVDESGIITLVSSQTEKLFGYNREELVGQPVEILMPERFRKTHVGHRAGYMAAPHLRTLDHGLKLIGARKDGSEFAAEINLSPVETQAGVLITCAIRDITERRKAEEKLRASETRFRRLFEAAQDGILLLDIDTGQVVDANPFLADLLGSPREEILGKRLWELGLFADVAASREAFAELKREGYIRYEDLPLQARDGRRVEVEFVSNVYEVNGSSVIQCNIRDITDRKRTGEELRRLTARLLEVQDEERRQVAYDIHDGLGQLMTAASMHLEAFSGRRDAKDADGAGEEFAKAKRCLRDAVVEMRRMVSELGPLLLEDVGLVEASRRLLSDMAARMNWESEFDSEGIEERLDGMAETALFRIVQEALANIAKHADSPKVRLRFSREQDVVAIEIRDWGRGFADPAAVSKPERGRHVGLLGMRERAALIGAEFSVESSPGDGTRVLVEVPVAPPAARLIGRKRAEVVRMAEATKVRGSSRDAITVLIADDHPMVREGLRSMLDTEGIEIIGEAVNGADAVEQAQHSTPDVVLMDVRMPDMDGLAATEIIKQAVPQTSIVVITSYESKEYLRRAIEAGAAGYLLKGMSRESLIDAIRLVKGGGSLIDARLLSELLKDMGVEGSRFQGVEGALEALTPREQEVLNLLVRGLTNKEIASEMHYSVGTVKNVVQRVIEKLGVSDRTQAAVYAVRAGMSAP